MEKSGLREAEGTPGQLSGAEWGGRAAGLGIASLYMALTPEGALQTPTFVSPPLRVVVKVKLDLATRAWMEGGHECLGSKQVPSKLIG